MRTYFLMQPGHGNREKVKQSFYLLSTSFLVLAFAKIVSFLSNSTMNGKAFFFKFAKSITTVWCLMCKTPGTKRKLPQHTIYNDILYENNAQSPVSFSFRKNLSVHLS